MAADKRSFASEQQIDKLVANLAQFPQIWDISLHTFHDRDATAKSWQALAALCGLSVKDCKQTYETQRRKFRQVSIITRSKASKASFAEGSYDSLREKISVRGPYHFWEKSA